VFHHPVSVGDEVSVYGEIIKIGRSSLTIAVEAWRRHRQEETAVKVTEATFTFVAVDQNNRPRPVDS
jgi:acyl-CoA thioesterase YciA